MPIYEYRCRTCGQVSEVLVHGFSSPGVSKCPACGCEMERLLSSPALLKNAGNSGTTCCGREERCEQPPCSTGERCRRH